MNSRQGAKHAPFDCRSGQALSAVERGREDVGCVPRTVLCLWNRKPRENQQPATGYWQPTTEQPICLTRRHRATENQDGEMHRPSFPTVRHDARGATCQRHIARSVLAGRGRSGRNKHRARRNVAANHAKTERSPRAETQGRRENETADERG